MLKKSFVRVTGLLLTLLLLMSTMPLMSASAYVDFDTLGTTEDGFKYQLLIDTIEEDIAMITGYTGDSSDIVIPAFVHGYPVRFINGFEYNDNLTSVVIPDGVETIGGQAFYDCKNLKSVSFPSSLKEIQARAFSGCESLEAAYIPGKVTKIYHSAFFRCTSLSELSIPSSVETIYDSAFYGCTSLTSLYLCNGLTEIEPRAFAYCTNLSYVRLPSTITTLTDAFFCCSSLTHVTVPSGVTIINDGAFSECTSLESVTLPASLESIGGDAFYHCISLESVKVNTGTDASYVSSDGVLYSSDMSELVYYPAAKEGETFTFPSEVTTIGYRAFNYNQNLKSLGIPNTVKTISEDAFRYSQNLSSVVFPETDTIERSMFYQCHNLKEITIPSTVTTIKPAALYGCTALSDVYFLGKRSQWDTLAQNSSIDSLENATIHCIYDCAELEGNSVTLFGDIGVNFYMSINDDVLADEDATVIFTYDNNVVEVPVSEGEETSNGYKYTCNIPAKDMITEVTCKVETYEGDSRTFTYTVKDYAEIILASPETYGEKTVALVKAMLNYGAAAQTYFGHNTDNLANDTEYMTEADKAVPEKDFSSLSLTLTEGADGVRYYGTALSLKSEVGIKHYFILSDDVNMEELKCTVDGNAAELKENGNLHELIISDIPAQNLYKKYEVRVGDLSLSYCAMDYAAQAQEAGKESLLKVMYALDAYTQCAVAYMS